jgi:uncharacterized protein (DUF433 family)
LHISLDDAIVVAEVEKENRMDTRVAMCETRRYSTRMGSTVGRIVSDPEILDGTPCVRGTRLSVEFLLELAASGATPAQILTSYPELTHEGLAAAFRYAAHALKREHTSGEPTIQATEAPGRARMRGWGSLKRFARRVDAGFGPEVDAEVARALEGRR